MFVFVFQNIGIHSVSRKEDENGYWSLDETKVCIFCAKQILLKHNENKQKHSKFMEEWLGYDALPYGIIPNEEMLIGHFIAIHDKRIGENIWYIFDENKLSLNPKERFKKLFERKDEWSMDEITPYLKTLIKCGHSVDKLLLRNARMIRKKDKDGNERRIYISRNAKRNR